MDPISAQLTLGVIFSWLIELIKRSTFFPWLRAETDKLNRFVSVVIAVASAVGIHVVSNHGTLSVSGLNWASIGTYAWLAAQQFVFQEASYRGLVKSKATLVDHSKADAKQVQPDPTTTTTVQNNSATS